MSLQKLGITPIYVRFAASYIPRGEGTYPCDSFGYDMVKVSVSQDWNNYALEGNPEAYFMVTRVEFYAEGLCMKRIEFKTHMVGGGSRETAFSIVASKGER